MTIHDALGSKKNRFIPALMNCLKELISTRRFWLYSAMILILLLGLDNSSKAQSCVTCKDETPTIGFTASVCSHHDYTVTLNGISVTGTGSCASDIWQTTDKAHTQLTVDETYTVTAGTDSCSTHIVFDVPKDFKLEIDGVETTVIDKSGGAKGGGDGSWKIVVRKKCDLCDDKGLGDGCQPKLGSVDWSVSMGSLSDGRSAKSINIFRETLSSAIYAPSGLTYSPPGLTSEVDVVRNPDLRQIKATEGLADIVVTIPGQEYEIRFYRAANVGAKVNGLYVVSGQPYIAWKIKNPEPSSTRRLQLSRTQAGFTDTSEYAWDAITNSWTLTSGGGARVETKTVTYPTATSRNETTIVKESNGQIVSKAMLTYHTFGWGEELLQEILDPDGAALKTSYTYYEDPSEAGRYARIKSIVHPDGSWEKYDYDPTGNQTVLMRPWKDLALASATEANSYVTRYTYSNFDGVVTSLYAREISSIEEQVAGVTVRRTTYARSGVTINGNPATREVETAYATVAVTQTTTRTKYHYSADPFYANRTISVEYPDGSSGTHEYEKGNYLPDPDPSLSQFIPDANGVAQRETLTHGTASSPNGIAFKTLKETSIRDQYGRVVLQESSIYNGVDYERIGWTAMDYNDLGQPTQTRRHNGEVTNTVWNGNRRVSQSAANGIQTDYTYDALVRVRTQTKKGVAASGSYPAQVDIVTTYNYDAEGRQTSETTTGDSLSLGQATAFDLAGRIKSSTDEAGLVTTYAYTNGGRTQTVSAPGGATTITDNYLDGQTKSVTGSGVVARYFDYGVNADGTRYTQEFVGNAGLNSPRWTKTTTDWLGRTIKVEKPNFTGTNVIQSSIYNAPGQLQKQTTTAGTNKLLADMLYEYDQLGRQMRAGADIDASGALTLLSTDRLGDTDKVYEKVGNDWFLVTSTRTYLTDNNDTPTVQTQRARLNNFLLSGTEQTVSEVTVTDVAGNSTTTSVTIDRAAKKETSITDTPDSNANAVRISVNALLQSSTPTTPQSATTYAYDSLGRQISMTSPRTGTITQSYSQTSGQLTATNDGAGTTLFEYYSATHVYAGQLKTQTNAAGKKVYFNYSNRRELIQTWGDATYPIEYVYDAYGQKTEMHTFRGGQSWTASTWPAATSGTADVTKWIYQSSTGLLTQKQDATLKGASYTYDEMGRLKTRVWARSITCTYGYDPNTGEMRTVTYSDSTPALTFAYDRGGRQVSVTDASGTHTQSFNAAGELQTDQITGGILDGVGVTIGYDNFLRRNSLQTSQAANTLSSQTYGYDSSSRMETITSGSQTATYAYYSNSGLLNTTSFTGGTNIARTYDPQGRLQNITTTPASDTPQSYTYAYNNLNQRWRLTREDGSYWSYIYNDRGELVTGKKYWSDNSIVWGAQTEYNFDNIGNRNYARNGGNQLGSLRQSNYTANSLNQYSQRSVPGAVDVSGTANTAATVTVNSQATARRADYFYRELAVDNSAAPANAQINVVGARNNFGAGGEDAVTEKGGRVFVPQALETFTHDDDGNLTADGRWVYSWDAENRLISLEATANVPAEAKQRLDFAYDYAGRRIQKKTYTWNITTSTYELTATSKFINDGWNVVAQLNGSNNLQSTYVWGKDISGSFQAAGGVGGLLLISAGGDTHQVAYDGNGNVVALTKASTGTNSGSYEYDPFGNSLKATGEYAASNPFRFSTKYLDMETGHLYFGYRYYSPQTAKWISRDPMEEGGGVNLYGFVKNNGISNIDPLGLSHRSDIAAQRLDYSCKCGWIDWGHAEPDANGPNARMLWQSITANKGDVESYTKKGYAVMYGQSFVYPGNVGSDGVTGTYFVRYNLSKDEQILVALSITKEVSERFEKLQASFPYGPFTNSGFSEEDLVSDLIAINRAIKNYSQGFVAATCRVVPDSIAEAIWDRTGGLKQMKTWTPNYYNDVIKGCCQSKAEWPNQLLKMQAIPKGDLWRDWMLKVDYFYTLY